MRLTHKILSFAALLLLNACLLVDQFGKAWDEAKPEPCLGKIAESLYYAEFRRSAAGKDMDTLARGWSIGNQHFLFLKKNADDQGGRLYRFDVIPGKVSPIFRRYRLAPTMRVRFEADYPNAPVSLKRDTVRLATLDDKAIRQLLAEISAKPEYWEIEDQTLYNTLGNPACQFGQPTTDKQSTRKKS